jgi:hypothetical protein
MIIKYLKTFLRILSFWSLYNMAVYPFPATTNEIKYPVYQIPNDLRVNAKDVIRYAENILQIKSISEATYYHKIVLTILNENGLKDAIFMQQYDQFKRIHNICGTVYNESGEKVEQLNRDDVIDHSAISTSSFFDDNRIKYFEPKYRKVPFTVEYSFETTFIGIMDFPAWIPNMGYNVSVQKSICKVIAPDTGFFKYYKKNYNLDPIVEKNDNHAVTYTWSIENQNALEEEPFAESPLNRLPVILFAPKNFIIENIYGSMESWNSFGKWIWEVNKNRSQLDDERKVFINGLIQNCTTNLEKAQKIYAFFQEKTRYLSIQIGIGSWQPMEAGKVDRLGYGDCKALVNYLKSLLSLAGINSYYTLALAGENAPPIIQEFPCQQFNHVILCLPLEEDTVWIECTNQHIPFGYIGTFTDNRRVLVINDQGGKIAHTRKYNPSENLRQSSLFVSLDEAGNADAFLRTSHCGIFFDKKFELPFVDVEKQKKLIYDEINLAGMVLNSFQCAINPGFVPVLEESVRFYAPKYSSALGDRIFVQFKKMDNISGIPRRFKDRKSDVEIKRDYYSIDSVTIKFPESYAIESLPSNLVVTSDFGYCEYSFISNGNNLVEYIRKVMIRSGISPPDKYPDLLDFYNKIISGDNLKMCLKKKVT